MKVRREHLFVFSRGMKSEEKLPRAGNRGKSVCKREKTGCVRCSEEIETI